MREVGTGGGLWRPSPLRTLSATLDTPVTRPRRNRERPAAPAALGIYPSIVAQRYQAQVGVSVRHPDDDTRTAQKLKIGWLAVRKRLVSPRGIRGRHINVALKFDL